MAENDRIKFDDDVIARVKGRDAQSAIHRKGSVIFEKDAESAWSVDVDAVVDERDYKKKQVFKGWTLMWLAYQSTGVIYGDIGTSPLYVYSSTFSEDPSYDDLLGALSLIIWSLTLIVTIKYVLIVLCADDEGEGGTFAIYTLLSRYCDIMKRDPRANHGVRMERYLSTELKPSHRNVRSWLEKSNVAHGSLKILAVFGVSLIMADGILTPAQSVLGAIQGLEIVSDNVTSSLIVGVSCAILILLFLIQPLGIARLASTFAPVVIIWLFFNLSFGIYNLAMHDYTVLKAFSPYFAGAFFIRNKTEGWKALGGILLCFTGVEALFADLGAFSKRAIQISWLGIAYPCLLLAYIGQAAYISRDPTAYSNPFFKTVPPGMFYPSLVISVLAAVVASQALITSTFQLLSQVMHSSYFPQIKMVYTSDLFHGQVYIPWANWLMMVGTVIVTAVYSNTTKLGQAYGVCVILVTFITTNLVTLVALIVWRTNPILVFAIWLPFVTFDGLYLSSALTKFPNGAWFTLLLAVILASFFTLWRYGKEKQWASEAKDRFPLSSLIQKGEPDCLPRLAPRFGGGELTFVKGLGIFFDKSGDWIPQVYEQFLCKFEAQMDVVVLLHLKALSVPHVADNERYTVARTSAKNVYRLAIRHGYKDRVVSPDLGRLVYEEVRKAIVRIATRSATAVNSEHASTTAGEITSNLATSAMTTSTDTELDTLEVQDAGTAARLRALDTAYSTQTLYLVGKEQLRILPSNNLLKRALLGMFLWVRENTRAKVAQLDVPVEKLVEVGFVGLI